MNLSWEFVVVLMCHCCHSETYICQNTNKSDNCSTQDSRPRPRHITARLRERSPVWHLRPPLLQRLEMVQRSAVRVVLRLRRYDRRSMTAALQPLHWLPVKYRIEYKLLVICVSRPTRADAGVHCLADHTVRAASRLTIG